MKNVCRICSTDENPFYSLKDDQHLLKKLEDFTSSEVVIVDSTSNIICLNCMVKLNESHSFQQLAKKSNSVVNIKAQEPSLKKKAYSQSTIKSNVNFPPEVTNDETDANETVPKLKPEEPLKKKKLRRNTKNKLSPKPYPTKGTSLVNLKGDIDRSFEFSYLCEKCNKNFKTKSALNLHLIDHRNKPTFTCNLCKESFVLSATLHAHMQKHAEVNRYKCSVCNRTYNVIYLLERHMKMHAIHNPQICEYCHLAFVTKIDLNKHVFQSHATEKFASLS